MPYFPAAAEVYIINTRPYSEFYIPFQSLIIAYSKLFLRLAIGSNSFAGVPAGQFFPAITITLTFFPLHQHLLLTSMQRYQVFPICQDLFWVFVGLSAAVGRLHNPGFHIIGYLVILLFPNAKNGHSWFTHVHAPLSPTLAGLWIEAQHACQVTTVRILPVMVL